ncbi:Serine/threonine-protein kinase H1-like protein [Aphelenchoides besseyi]|nr:Serine/threonine-protein kinase H1-like protein [Aphelenchoides besseyi]
MGNKCSSRNHQSKRQVVPKEENQSGKKKNFFVQLFAKHRFDAAALAQTYPPPVGGEMPIGESAYFKDRHREPRPADTQLFNKYEVMSIIGKGSFSQVLRVQHRLTRQYYAVKLVSSDSDINAVNNELAILSRVQHPFVIRLEEVLRGANRLFIVMEMASGGEMYDRVVSKGRYTETEARQALRMLLNGLAYLHDMKITHRDLKPENLLYSDTRPDARLLITDFGLAHQAKAAGEKMTETCGTPEYISPEVLLRVPYTERVDMWAVGVIAYILLSGIMPFDDDVRSRLYTQIITANYVYYPQYWSGSDHAKIFVDSLLETNPEMRLSAIDALRHDWILGEQRVHLNVSIKARPASEFNSMQRTKSTRSIRSVTRSDHGHRVDPREVDRLANDLQQLAKSRTRNSSTAGGYEQQTKHYGVF